jgi:hypothetical protein
MESSIFTEHVRQALSDTFEGMAFLELVHDDTPVSPAGTPGLLWGKVPVHAPTKAAFAVLCPHDLVRTIAESLFLEEVDEAKLHDALGEIVNTVAGKTLSLSVPANVVFSLGVPETGEGVPVMDNPTVYSCSTDEGLCIFVITNLIPASL